MVGFEVTPTTASSSTARASASESSSSREKRSIWEQGEAALGVAPDELRTWLDALRREIGSPWAEDQKLAALAAWIALARSS